MPTLWRELFNDLGVAWKDHGRNWSRGHININCCFCADDPGFHCSISETKDVFYCYRDPRHSGSALKLVQQLLAPTAKGHARIEAQALLTEYATDAEEIRAPVAPPIPYDKFPLAVHNQRMLDYLSHRGFVQPELVCARFNLRYAEAGTWAMRLLLPMVDAQGEVRSFVGRAVRSGLEPRYRFANADLVSNLVYGVLTGRTIVIVEGPIDALKINVTFYDRLYEISAVALTGRSLAQSRLELLTKLSAKQFMLALDDDVDPWRVASELNEVARPAGKRVGICYLPAGYNDPGELSLPAITEWLGGINAVPMGRGGRGLD